MLSITVTITVIIQKIYTESQSKIDHIHLSVKSGGIWEMC